MTDFTTGQWAYRSKPTEPVTILTTQRPGSLPILTMDAHGSLRMHYPDGNNFANTNFDLVPLQTPRPPVEGWVNVDPSLFGARTLFATREEADRCASPDRIACVFVRETEGGK